MFIKILPKHLQVSTEAQQGSFGWQERGLPRSVFLVFGTSHMTGLVCMIIVTTRR